ncbi:MAG TPA: hypothetical protein EYP68_02290 [Candidatus Korarchaeota archaeon]|nr:hypothetical protein [Candidatus Korarchaeota archaeon]
MSEEKLPFSLRPNERILWSGRPETAPYIGKSLIFTIVGFFFAIPATAVLLEIRGAPLLFLLPPSIIAMIGCLLAIIPPLRNILSLKRVKYIITNKRVVILGGALDLSVKTIDFPDIESIVIRRGFWDRKFGTSTLYLIIRGVLIVPSFSSISDAERVKELIEKLIAQRK